jgi:hypothetical protein
MWPVCLPQFYIEAVDIATSLLLVRTCTPARLRRVFFIPPSLKDSSKKQFCIFANINTTNQWQINTKINTAFHLPGCNRGIMVPMLHILLPSAPQTGNIFLGK